MNQDILLLRTLLVSAGFKIMSELSDFISLNTVAVTALETEQWESQRNWKDIFATEVATRIERSYLKVNTDLGTSL